MRRVPLAKLAIDGRVVPVYEQDLVIVERTSRSGAYDDSLDCILLKRGLGSEDRRVALFHEVMHACFGNAPQYRRYVEEQVCQKLDVLLLDALRENPWLSRQLLGPHP